MVSKPVEPQISRHTPPLKALWLGCESWWIIDGNCWVTMSGDGGCKVSLVELSLWVRFFFFNFFNFLIWVLFGSEVWIMWCLVGTVWVWGRWVGSDGWCCGGQWLGHTMLTNGSGFCFEFYFIFWICLRCDVIGFVWLPCVILDLIGLILVWWREDFCFWNVM